ncbi:MAG: transposase [Bacteroidota bacterium]
MMRKNLYIILMSVTAVLLGCIFIFSKKPGNKIPSYKERRGSIALTGEWLNTKQAIDGLLKTIELNPNDYKSKLSLSQAYIQEARITGDHAYYDQAALELLDDVIKNEPKNFDALCCKATVLLSQHHFTEGLIVAQQALPINPNSAFIYGLLCDAYVELGKYPDAVKVCDKMISIRPDIRSYARVSYLREIHGDLNGAIEAAKLAVAAGYPGLEQSEWTRMILAHLYENKGQLDSAEIQYKIALTERPDYAFAIAGLSNIAKQKGNYKLAIAGYEKAKNIMNEYSFEDELTDLYNLNNEPAKAKKSSEKVIAMLSPLSDADESSSTHGHYADKELAYAYLKVPDTEKALQHAMIEYERRPNNIDVCETLAWVNYKKGNYDEANKLIDKALKTNCQNPSLLCHAGLIKIKAGQKEKGRELVKKALETNPYLDIELQKEAKGFIASL